MLKEYFGCECQNLNHISRFCYIPLEKEEIRDEENNVIYLSIKSINCYNRIIPSLNPFDFIGDIPYFWHFHILRRIPIALYFIFNSNYNKEDGVLDSFMFRDEDLYAIKNNLSQITESETEMKIDEIILLSNERWLLQLYVEILDSDVPYWIGWKIQFLSRNLFGRIKYALKYIFGVYDDEQEFEIDEKTAKRLKGLITIYRKTKQK